MSKFPNEAALTDFVANKLEQERYQVSREVTIYPRRRVDILAKKPEKNIVVQVKLHERGISDDISKSEELLIMPEIDLVYIAAPKLHLSDHLMGFAKRLGVGVIGVTDQGIEWLIEGEKSSSARLSLGASHKTAVYVGETFEIKLSANNNGGKIARNISFMYLPAYPFRLPKGEKNRRSVKQLEPGKNVEVSFKIKVQSDAPSKKYPLYTRVTAEQQEPREDVFWIEVVPPPREKENEKLYEPPPLGELRDENL